MQTCVRSNAAEGKQPISVRKVSRHSTCESVSLSPADLDVTFEPALADEVVLIFFDFLVDVVDLALDGHNFVESLLHLDSGLG